MQKYFKIGEVSRLFGIGADSLRYYEEVGAIQPVRGENGYRLYKTKDIWRLNVIRDLRALGFSMQRIGEHLNNRSREGTLQLLRQEQEAIDKELRRLRRQRRQVTRRMETIEAAARQREGVIRRESFKLRRCYEIQEGYGSDEEMDVLIQRLLRRDPSRLYIIGSNSIGSRISLAAALAGRCNAYNAVFVIDQSGDSVLAGGEYLCVSYHGSSRRGGEFIPRLLEYAAENGLEPAGDILELLLVDIHVAENEAEHTTELQLPVVRLGG